MIHELLIIAMLNRNDQTATTVVTRVASALSTRLTMLPRGLTLLLLNLLACSLVTAQFPFFDNMFRQQQEQQQHSGPSLWAAHTERSTPILPCSV